MMIMIDPQEATSIINTPGIIEITIVTNILKEEDFSPLKGSGIETKVITLETDIIDYILLQFKHL